MHSSKTNVKKTVFLVVFVLLGLFMNQLGVFLFTSPGTLSRIVMRDAYKNYPESDVVVLGSSEALYAIDPFLFEEKTGKSCIGLGSSATTLYGGVWASYDSLVAHYNPETIVLMVGAGMYQKEEAESPISYSILAPYLDSPIATFQYMYRVSEQDQKWMERVAYWNGTFNLKIHENIPTKLESGYRNYSYDYVNGLYHATQTEDFFEPSLIYRGKGYCYRPTENPYNVRRHYNLNLKETLNLESLEEDFQNESKVEISDENYATIAHIAKDCKKRGIELILLAAPVPTTSFFNMSYGIATTGFEEVAEELGIAYYDLNLCKTYFYKMLPDDAYDEAHLNGVGSTRYTEAFASVFSMREEKEKVDDLFLTWVERCRAQDYLAGIVLCEEENCYEIRPVAGENVEVTYQFTKVASDGSESVLQEYSTNNIYFLTSELGEDEFIRAYALDQYGNWITQDSSRR